MLGRKSQEEKARNEDQEQEQGDYPSFIFRQGGRPDFGGRGRRCGEVGQRRVEDVDAVAFVPNAVRRRTEPQRAPCRQRHEWSGTRRRRR